MFTSTLVINVQMYRTSHGGIGQGRGLAGLISVDLHCDALPLLADVPKVHFRPARALGRRATPGLFIWTDHDSTGRGVAFQPACLPP